MLVKFPFLIGKVLTNRTEMVAAGAYRRFPFLIGKVLTVYLEPTVVRLFSRVPIPYR